MTDLLNNPLVSVLMTVYNREKYVAEAIESVLSSTYNNFELIIVDDASSDNSLEIVKFYEVNDPRIKIYVNDKNLGDYPNRNKAASYAKGKYLKYVDSDDKIFEKTLQFMVEEMEKHPSVGFGFSSRDGVSTILHSPRDAFYCHFFNRGILDLGPTFLIFNRQKFEALGKFATIRNVSDFDMCLRMATRYPVLEMKSGLVYWREHEEQEFRIDPEKYIEYGLKIILNALSNKNCPLNEEEKRILSKKYKRLYSYSILKGLIISGKPKKYLSYWFSNKLKISDLLF